MSLASLSLRPKWKTPRFILYTAIVSFILCCLFWFGSELFFEMGEATLGPGEEDDEMWLHYLSYACDDIAIGTGYLSMTLLGCWVMALGVDKLDQLVWLAASDDDRQEIIDNHQKNENNA